MKKQIKESIKIPEGIECEFKDKTISCKSNESHISRLVDIPGVSVKIIDKEIIFESKGNKSHYKKISTIKSHIKNMFKGFQEPFIYTLEAVNVHFPMNLKVEENKLLINNFLGEKTPRVAVLPEGVKIEVKGQEVTVSSADKELAGISASTIEKTTKVKGRDRRIFQDGIYIKNKAGKLI